MRIIVIGILVVAFSAKAQDPKEIIRKYIDTVSNGNIDNWKKITTVYTESIGAYSQDNFTDAKPELDVMRPDFSKTYVSIPYQQKIEIYDDSTCALLLSKFYFLKDKTVIFIGNLPPIEKPGNKSPHQFLAVRISDLLKKSKSVILLGTKVFETDSIACFEIEMKTKEETERLYINTQTYLLEYTSKLRDGGYPVMARYAGYKKFGELLFPTKEVNTRKDLSTHKDVPFYWMHILKMDLNKEIDPKEFTY
jgi:hypothetical protein